MQEKQQQSKRNKANFKCHCGLVHDIEIFDNVIIKHDIHQPKDFQFDILKATLKPTVEKILKFYKFELENVEDSKNKSMMFALIDMAEGSEIKFNAIMSLLGDFKRQLK